jgi:hypothetical protein
VRSVSSGAAAAARLLDGTRRRTELPVVLGVDVEPDDRVFGRCDARRWSGFERFLERLPPLRERLAELTGAPAAATWFLRMDTQVAETWGSSRWVADAYGDALAGLTAHGDELGLHTHTWRWDSGARHWVADYRDEAWAEHCLATGLEAFASAFGRPCLAHRSGDHFLSPALLAGLEAAGVRVDLTIEPGWPPVSGLHDHELKVGSLPDYRRVPRTPYRSSPDAFPAPVPGKKDGTLLVPLFSPPALRRRHRLPLAPDGRHFASRLAFELLVAPPPVLAFVVRTDAALDSWDRVARNLEHLARHQRVKFVTATAAAARFAP